MISIEQIGSFRNPEKGDDFNPQVKKRNPRSSTVWSGRVAKLGLIMTIFSMFFDEPERN
jgi:hypothetical protein